MVSGLHEVSWGASRGRVLDRDTGIVWPRGEFRIKFCFSNTVLPNCAGNMHLFLCFLFVLVFIFHSSPLYFKVTSRLVVYARSRNT